MYMAHMIHAKKDVSCIGDHVCLLARPSGNNYLLCTNAETGLFDAYLFFDNNADEFISDGSATGVGGFGGHYKKSMRREHGTKEMTTTQDSTILTLLVRVRDQKAT